MKKILIITSYFPPETGAASNRIFELSKGLQEKGLKVSVVTPLPNYPTGNIFKAYKGKIKATEIINDITVHRLWVFASNSKSKVLRLIAMLSYSFSLFWFLMTRKIPKKVIVQSPPLLVAFTCMFWLHNKRQLILNVSDLWPIAGLELGALKENFSYKVLEKIELYNYKKATLILGQSEEIISHVNRLKPDKKTLLYRNYPSFKPPNIIEEDRASKKIKIVYAGLLGIAQGIYKLCENIDCYNIELHIYGAGAEVNKVLDFIKENPKLPITYHGEITRKELHKTLIHYDVAIIPLLNRIYGSVPSKIFEYARLGIPLLYFGGGEGEGIIKHYNLGWVAEAGDYEALNQVILNIKKDELTLQKRKTIQETAIKHFNGNNQIKEFYQLLANY